MRWHRRRPQEGQALLFLLHLRHAAASEVGSELLKGKRDLAKAKQLIKEAGYKGEKIVILSATDQPIVHRQGW